MVSLLPVHVIVMIETCKHDWITGREELDPLTYCTKCGIIYHDLS